MHKTIRLYAYINCNLGDDLFVSTLADRYPESKVYLHIGQQINNSFYKKKNIVVYTKEPWYIQLAGKIKPSFSAGIKNLQEKHCNALVYIGGSLFIEYSNWETILTWWRYKAEHSCFFVMGSNFGPWHTEEYRRQMAEVFNKMQDVCFRDTYSQKLFADVPSVRYAPDILLGYPMPKVSIKHKQAFISVINCETKDEGDNHLSVFDRQYVEVLSVLINSLANKGWKVIISSFCKNEGDEAGIEKILQNVQDTSHIEVINYHGTNAEEVLYRLAESEIVYGSRFHAVILGFAARRPVVPIIYSDKTKRVLEDMRFSGRLFDVRELDKNDGLQMARLSDAYERQYLNNVDGLCEQSEEHFKRLDLLIQGKKSNRMENGLHKNGFRVERY